MVIQIKCDHLKGSSSTSHTLSSTLLFQQKTNLTSNVTLLTSKETPYVHNLLCHTSNVTNINDSSPCTVVGPQMSSNVMNILEEVRPQLQDLLKEYIDVFPNNLSAGLPSEQFIDHSIETFPTTKPISKPPY